MVSFFYNLSPIVQALIGTLFTWGVTALGASLVFFFKTINKKMLNAMLGFAAGVMVAASFWSLLNPAIILSEELGHYYQDATYSINCTDKILINKQEYRAKKWSYFVLIPFEKLKSAILSRNQYTL